MIRRIIPTSLFFATAIATAGVLTLILQALGL